MQIKRITNFLESYAPLDYQEIYDNSGLIVGDANKQVKGALITLDCTEDVIDEAIAINCNLVIAHHPIIFAGLKKLNGSNYIQRTVIKAIRNDIAIYAIHTNLDNVYNGVNTKIAEKLGLENCEVLDPKSDLLRQLVVYCPTKNAEKLKTALFKNGAGAIGNYDKCSFSSAGMGTFSANKDCKPFIGKVGELHIEDEDRIEVIYPKYKEKAILNAMKTAHPYEQVAYQIYMLENKHQLVGSGIVGDLKKAVKTETFLQQIKTNMKTESVRYSNLVKKEVKRIAVCGGSGSFLLNKAKKVGADIFITSDVKYHDFFDANNQISIFDIGHYESEYFTQHLIFDIVKEKFSKLAVHLTNVCTIPIIYY